MPGKLIHDVALAFTGIRIQILLFCVFFFRFFHRGFFGFRFRAAYGFQFGNGFRIERSEPFAFRFETLYADETFRINFLRVAETVVPAERDLQPWIASSVSKTKRLSLFSPMKLWGLVLGSNAKRLT